MKNKASLIVPVAISRGDEIYYGEKTGNTVYHCEVARVESENDFANLRTFGAVLGRGYDAESAAQDFARRARADGLKFDALSICTSPPACGQVLSLREFVPGFPTSVCAEDGYPRTGATYSRSSHN